MEFALAYDKKGEEDPLEVIIKALDEAQVYKLSDPLFANRTLRSTIEFSYNGLKNQFDAEKWMKDLTLAIEPHAYVRLYLISHTEGEEKTDLGKGFRKTVKDMMLAEKISKNQHIQGS